MAAWILLVVYACRADIGSTVPEVTSTDIVVTSTRTEVGSTTPPEAEPVEGTWGLDSITVDGEPMVLSPEFARFQEHPGVAAWITFHGDGNVDGQLTCNGFLGEYEQRGSVIEWEVVLDAGACAETEGIMEAEAPMSDLIWTQTVVVDVDESAGTLQLTGSDVVMTFDRIES